MTADRRVWVIEAYDDFDAEWRPTARVALNPESGQSLADTARANLEHRSVLYVPADELEALTAAADQSVACPNCGCDYQTAQDLREWKDRPELSDRLNVAEAAADRLRTQNEELQKELARVAPPTYTRTPREEKKRRKRLARVASLAAGAAPTGSIASDSGEQ